MSRVFGAQTAFIGRVRAVSSDNLSRSPTTTAQRVRTAASMMHDVGVGHEEQLQRRTPIANCVCLFGGPSRALLPFSTGGPQKVINTRYY